MGQMIASNILQLLGCQIQRTTFRPSFLPLRGIQNNHQFPSWNALLPWVPWRHSFLIFILLCWPHPFIPLPAHSNRSCSCGSLGHLLFWLDSHSVTINMLRALTLWSEPRYFDSHSNLYLFTGYLFLNISYAPQTHLNWTHHLSPPYLSLPLASNSLNHSFRCLCFRVIFGSFLFLSSIAFHSDV